jgi:hypothetical protein
MSIQMRALGLIFSYVPQRRLIDVIYAKETTPPWVHSGATPLLNYAMLDDNNVPIGSRFASPREMPLPPDEGIREDFSRRASLGKLIVNNFPIPGSNFNIKYNNALDKMIRECNLSNIDQNIAFFKTLLKNLL